MGKMESEYSTLSLSGMHLENLDRYMEDHFEDSEKAIETGRSKKTTEPGVVS